MPARDMLDVLVTYNRVVDANQAVIENVTRFVSGLSFSAAAMGGFTTAMLSLTMPEAQAWKMLDDYVGCRLVVTNPLALNSGHVVWEGLIYSVDVDDGRTAVSRTMANVYNRVRVVYSTLNTGASPPAMGVQTVTADADLATSANTYGIRELTYTIGGAETTSAEDLRDTLLNQYSTPIAAVTQVSRGGGPGTRPASNVSIQCAGYWETLDKRIYRQTVATTTAAMDTIIKAVLTGVAQFANSDQTNVGSNPRLHTQYFHQYLTAQTVIGDLCAKGDANDTRWYFGLYENGLAYYAAEPTTVRYRTHRLDPNEAIFDVTAGRFVPPWLVRPGYIISIDDLLPDEVVYSSALDNARAFVIGEVRFTSPYTVEIVPQVKDPTQVQLSKMGLTQIGA